MAMIWGDIFEPLNIRAYISVPFHWLVQAWLARTKKRNKPLPPVQKTPPPRERISSRRRTQIISSSSRAESPLSMVRKKNTKLCYFLEKLPYEIRHMICIQVLGGNIFRIEERKHNLCHMTCFHKDACPCGQACACRVGCNRPVGMLDAAPKRPRRQAKRPKSQDEELLGLAKTCRIIYRESIDIVYSHNTFHIPSWKKLDAFTRTILPQRLNSVKTMYVRIDLQDVTEAAWTNMWSRVAELKKLETLQLYLQWNLLFAWNLKDERAILEPLRCIKNLLVFDIETSWARKGNYDDAPFAIGYGRHYTTWKRRPWSGADLPATVQRDSDVWLV